MTGLAVVLVARTYTINFVRAVEELFIDGITLDVLPAGRVPSIRHESHILVEVVRVLRHHLLTADFSMRHERRLLTVISFVALRCNSLH